MRESTPGKAAPCDLLAIEGGAVDVVEAALVEALKVATAAVDVEAIKLLAVEIRERRLARAGVVDLGSRRGRR